MRLEIKNINKIAHADIQFNGLTVIAGVNDSGKSTIGKVMFALVKAVTNVNSNNDAIRKQNIKRIANSISRYLGYNQTGLRDVQALRGTLYQALYQAYEMQDLELLEVTKEQCLNSVDSPRHKSLISRELNRLKDFMQESKSQAEAMKVQFHKLIEGEFLNNICTNGTVQSDISFEGDGLTCRLLLEGNKVREVKADSFTEFPLTDATFVESPLYMHFIDTFAMARTLEESSERYTLVPYVHSHVKDFASKMDTARFIVHLKTHPDCCSEITGGSFVYDEKTRTIVWRKKDKDFSTVNVASGIKSFGVMQILKEVQAISDTRMLIWDEPENHLHPDWQIKLAKLLVESVKEGIPVLVSSHSPYFIQAVRYFAECEEVKDAVNFYLTEENEEGLVEMEEVTHDLNRVFQKLARPMNEIMNI